MYPAFRSLLLFHRQRWLSPCWTQNWEAGDHFYLAFLSSPGDQTHSRCWFFSLQRKNSLTWIRPPEVVLPPWSLPRSHKQLWSFSSSTTLCIPSNLSMTAFYHKLCGHGSSPPQISPQKCLVFTSFFRLTQCLTVLIILITIILTTIIFRHLIWARHYSKYLTWNNDSFNQHSNPIS